MGLPELIDPAKFPLLGTLTPESLALLRSEAYVKLIQRLKEIRGEIAGSNTSTGFRSEDSSGVLTGIGMQITASQQALLELNKK